MPHPIDDLVLKYGLKRDELANIERRLGELETLQNQKAALEQDLADLRVEMGEAHAKPATTIGKAKPNDLLGFKNNPHDAEK